MKYVLAAVLLLLLPAMASAEEETTVAKKCTSDEASNWREAGERKLYVFDLENTCDFRISCELHISIMNTYELLFDHKTVAIEPKAHGSLVLWVKGYGGMTSRRHSCKQV